MSSLMTRRRVLSPPSPSGADAGQRRRHSAAAAPLVAGCRRAHGSNALKGFQRVRRQNLQLRRAGKVEGEIVIALAERGGRGQHRRLECAGLRGCGRGL